jgi:U4/U6 small nuclear ribonucleoprotein PRP31
MSLADLLKDDFDDDAEDEELDELYQNKISSNENQLKNETTKEISDAEMVDYSDTQNFTNSLSDDANKSIANAVFSKLSVRSVAKLIDSDNLKSIIERIEFYQSEEGKKSRSQIIGPVEQDPEYKLIVDANNITVEIDNEIGIVHKFIRDHYSKRFPELESLVPNPLDYIRTAKELGNQVERAKNNEELQKFLTTATIMVVSVSASTTQGKKLEEHEIDLINEACNIVLKLNDYKLRIFEYVESRMTFIAPNLSQVVGASTAAKLMGVAGGLTNLSKMPACNILLLGQQKKVLSGFSTHQVIPHTGYIYYSDLVQNLPSDLRRKVARILASKCTLAARVDSFHESRDGSLGNHFRSEVNMRIEKLQEPPAVKQVKALPVPLEQAKTKRGGRRARKMKERLGLTELRKQANRMTFGEIEEDAYQEDLSFSMGQIGKAGSGRIRAAQVDSKTKARISQKLQKTLQKQNNQWGGTSTVRKNLTAGTASSVAFSSVQGLEIINPNAVEREKSGTETAKYFSSASGFAKVSSVIPRIAK